MALIQEGILERLPSQRWGIVDDDGETIELTSGDVFELNVLGEWKE